MNKQSITCLALALAGICVATSCARVKVKKVPTSTQYSVWTDQMQRKADKMEGFRFYLPRPFVNVFESFPVRTDIYIADGHVTPDGKYVIVETVRPESGLNDYLAGIRKETSIPARAIGQPSRGGPQSAADALTKVLTNWPGVKTDDTKVETGGTDTAKPAAPAAPASTATTGINKRDVRNDNGAFAYQPMRGNMDIAYLPDFEEQFVVSSKAGLGNAQFSLNLGQGWSLQSFNSLSDNSELNKRIFDVIDESIRLAKAAAQAAAGIPPVDLAGAAKVLNPGAQSVLDSPEGKLVPGAAVSLKVVVIHYAAKGLYPVIKPRELQERLAQDGKYYMWYDLFDIIPRATPATAFDPTAVQRAQSAVANESGRFTVPRYPYQYISFNTFRYMVIELIRPEAKPFEYLYDRTGTTGSPGDRQAFDFSDVIRQNGAGGTPAKDPDVLSPAALDGLKGPLSVDGTANAFNITDAKQADRSVAIGVDAGTDTSDKKYNVTKVYAAIGEKAVGLAWPNIFRDKIGPGTVKFTTGASNRINFGTAATPTVGTGASPTKAQIETKANELTIKAGATDTDGFTFSGAVLTDTTLALTPVVRGTVSKRFTVAELEGAVQDKLNDGFKLTVVKKVVLNAAAVSQMVNDGNLAN